MPTVHHNALLPHHLSLSPRHTHSLKHTHTHTTHAQHTTHTTHTRTRHTHARTHTTHDDRLGSQEWLDFSLTKTAQMLSEKWPDANIYVVRYGPVVAHDVTRLCGRPLVGGTTHALTTTTTTLFWLTWQALANRWAVQRVRRPAHTRQRRPPSAGPPRRRLQTECVQSGCALGLGVAVN